VDISDISSFASYGGYIANNYVYAFENFSGHCVQLQNCNCQIVAKQ